MTCEDEELNNFEIFANIGVFLYYQTPYRLHFDMIIMNIM